jgi:integrase
MATVKIVLDTRRKKQSGKFPLVIRVRKSEQYFDIPTGTELLEQDFDTIKRRIKQQPQKNKEIQQLLTMYSSKVLQLSSEGNSFESIKNILHNKTDDALTLKKYWRQEIERLIHSGRAGNARVYDSSLGGLKTVINLDRPIKELQLKDLLHAEVELKKRGVSTNSVSVYMRTLRALCNKAINLDLVESSWYPFRKFNIRKEKTIVRALQVEEIRAFFALKLEPNDNLYYAQSIGKLIFLLRGINLRDLLQLTESSINNNRLVYKRAKTGKLYNINLHPIVNELLKLTDSNSSVNLLPRGVKLENIESNPNTVKKYMQVRKVINAHLKKIGKNAGIETPLSTYVFRYTYANIAKSLGYSKDMIAEALGHEYGNSVTGIYLEMFDSEMLDEMHNRIVEFVMESS